MRLFDRRKTGQAAPSKAEVLRARPLRNPSLTWGPDAKGDMVIHVPLAKKAWMERLGRFLPASDTRHILLDDIGADVWAMCDGETSIDAIRRHITAKYKLDHKEAEASLLEHLKQLAKRKLIVAVAGPDPAPTEEDKGLAPGSAARRRPRRKKR